ncbi:022034df-2427-4276-8b2a-11e78e224fe6 [Thermothielavioides terrestris]|uniref:022034df-2427-4276-8b2a-11e78e224fe6 n=1 Tax=Thermothielavioides terrestris TaxID=2587410 RepID=A0A3S4AK63_9PEZI|nr:022034df-2427-4276-8b2a-11e78e224fe6 [Thermothielavioides terrestris]
MGAEGEDTLKEIRKTLEPYVRPREEAARIRQILAVHLASCLPDGGAVGPLALIDADSIDTSSTARGLQKTYLEALSANIKARKEFAACCLEPRRPAGTVTAAEQRLDRLQEHLAAIRLRQRREKLQAIERGLNALGQKPAASPGFLDPAEIFRDSRPLPNVPQELVAAVTLDETISAPRVRDLIDQLEKHVLQTKLLLRREEQLLEKAKARSTARPGTISEGAKFEALNRTRAELINWIEAELGKAAGDDGNADGQDSQKHRASADHVNMEEQLVSITEKYTRYLDVRKKLLELVGQQPQPTIKLPTKEANPPVPAVPSPPPTAHVLTPYFEHLLSVAQEQKGLIAHKSHLSAVIAKQLRENDQVLDHLAEESQLLPAHPMPGPQQTRAAFADATSNETPGASSRVRPWVFAADSAKICTLEAVAEKIEEGQVALEKSMGILAETGRLVGQSPPERKEAEVPFTTEEDIWLAEGQPPKKMAGLRKHTDRTANQPAQAKTVWDMLDGNLGLLRSDRDSP